MYSPSIRNGEGRDDWIEKEVSSAGPLKHDLEGVSQTDKGKWGAFEAQRKS